MCISTIGTRKRATVGSMLASASPAETSFTMSAPASTAAAATAALRVSTEIATASARCSRIAAMTGMTRSISSHAGTAGAPGLVDSPPTSITSAPSETISSARATAAATDAL